MPTHKEDLITLFTQEIAQMRRMKALMDIKITQKEQKILWLNSLP